VVRISRRSVRRKQISFTGVARTPAGHDELAMSVEKRVDRAAHELRQDWRQRDTPLSGITVIDQVT
jgi:hypothetical protein